MATTNIATYIAQIESDRNTIRTKLTDLGLATSTSKLTDCATAINGIVNRGSVSATVQEGATYAIPAGYHDGSGTVSGVAGGGNYSLQSKSVTPTKAQQAITADSGYYGLSDVTVKAIPDNYQDVSSVDAVAADVLANKKIVTADGTLTAGTMPNNGTVTKILDTTTTSQTIAKGYHSGSGKVSITLETKTATPTEATQNITPSTGKVLSKVTVNPIPVKYADVTDVTAVAANVLVDKTIIIPKKGTDGTVTGTEAVEGTMADNGAVTKLLDRNNAYYNIPVGYHNGEGRVSVSLTEKTATPTKETQEIRHDTAYLTRVVVNPIPDAYQDVTGVTATADKVLTGSTFVDSEGEEVEGTMANKGAVTATLNTTTTSYTVPAGYHNGSGKVSITTETKTATPTKSAQNITPTSGKVLSKVTVNAIPAAYQDVTGVTATAGTVLVGSKYVDSSGALVEGTIPTFGLGYVSNVLTLDGMTETSIALDDGYYKNTHISLSSSIEEALAAI